MEIKRMSIDEAVEEIRKNPSATLTEPSVVDGKQVWIREDGQLSKEEGESLMKKLIEASAPKDTLGYMGPDPSQPVSRRYDNNTYLQKYNFGNGKSEMRHSWITAPFAVQYLIKRS